MLAKAFGGQGAHEGPGDEFRVQLPPDVERAQVHAEMAGLRVGQRQVTLMQQHRHMRPAGVALGRIAQHDHVRDRQRRGQSLRRPGMNFIVQGDPLRVLWQVVLELHDRSLAGHCAVPGRHDHKQYLHH